MTLTSVTLDYFAIRGEKSTCGLGENIFLLLKDSGIDLTYHQHTDAEWETIKQDLIQNKRVLHPTLPLVKVDGKVFNKTVPTMRYLCKRLGKYGGETDEEEYALDVVSDLVRDHLVAQYKVFRCKDAKILDDHFQNSTLKYLGIYNDLYSRNQGPYFLGEKISYVDFLVYHMLDEDNALEHVKDYTNVAKFIDTFSQRPALAEYLASEKKVSA